MAFDSFFRYLTISGFDVKWGVYITACGFERVMPKAAYPQSKHPSAYFFNFDSGRVLKEYQLLYITKGSGTLITKSGGTLKVRAGSVFVLYPDEWHTYQPDSNEGWDEYWMGIQGDMVANILEEGNLVSRARPLLHIGVEKSVVELYQQILEIVKEEPSGYQQIAVGMAIHLIGKLSAITRVRQFEGKEIESKIRQSMTIFRENTISSISPESVADQLDVGYSWFRKMFKNYTGLSPTKYFQQMKMQRAKELLLTTEMPVKIIAQELGFESNFYFSRQFKESTGLSPSGFKKAYLVWNERSIL
jgi:AraC-like DNA-binding protein